MSSKVLVVVYDQDIPQFELMTYCLNKNWQGIKHITIVYQGNILPIVTSINQQNFTQDWKIDLIPCLPYGQFSGNDLQQLDKIFQSIDESVQDVIVFDCKDFLLKPIDESYFKNNGQYRITKISDQFDEFYLDVHTAMGTTNSKINAVLNITPWIWNVEQLKKYWEYVVGKYPNDLSAWTEFYPRSEIASYYYYTQEIDQTPVIKFDDNMFMPTGGIWDHDTLADILQVVENFDQYESAVWKHHRRITDIDKTAITAMQLQKYSIPMEIINKWVENKHNLRS
jgi:hypothetical protein